MGLENTVYKMTIMSLKLANREKLEAVEMLAKQAKKSGIIEVRSQEVVCWNWPRLVGDSWISTEEPKEDGTFDRMGLNNSDVVGHYRFAWWLPRNWSFLKGLIKTWKEEIVDALEDISFKSLVRFSISLKSLYRALFVYHPFVYRRSGWLWVVDSLSSDFKALAYDMAEDLIAAELGYKDGMDYFVKTRGIVDHKRVSKLSEDILKSTPKQDMLRNLVEKQKLVKVAENMWASESDPTCFVIDDMSGDPSLAFDLRDGWTEQRVASHVALWFKVFYNVDAEPVIVKEES
jgi:hypothetical protein